MRPDQVRNPVVCESPVHLALQCVHGSQRRLAVGCGKRFERDCVPCADRWKRRIRRRLIRGASYAGELYFLTLTMPGDAVVGVDGIADAKQAWRTFSKRWRERYGARAAYYWIGEFQKRGVLHFHVLLRMPKPVPILRPARISVGGKLVRHRRNRAWFRSTSWWSSAILESGFGPIWEIEPVRRRVAVAAYLAPYLTKLGDAVGYQIVNDAEKPVRLHQSSRNWLNPYDRPAKSYNIWFLIGAGHKVMSLPSFWKILEFQTQLRCQCREASRFPSKKRSVIRSRAWERWLSQDEYPIPKGVADVHARCETYGRPQSQCGRCQSLSRRTVFSR